MTKFYQNLKRINVQNKQLFKWFFNTWKMFDSYSKATNIWIKFGVAFLYELNK